MSISTPLSSEPPSANAPGEREQLMAEFSIGYNGRHYEYNRYRYDCLSDAVNYARLQHSSAYSPEEGAPMPPPEDVEVPNESQRQLMAEFAITFQDGVYRLGAFRYDHLADAANYARLQYSRSHLV